MRKRILTLIILLFLSIIIFSACSAYYTGALRTGEDTFIIAKGDKLYHAKQEGRKLILKPYIVIEKD